MKRFFFLACLFFANVAQGREPILLPGNPNLAPDGSTIVFDWHGDIWTVPTAGGVAKPLTRHSAADREPKFSPDGKEIAFISDREGSSQVYVMAAEGGTPRQITYHTAGYSLQGWYPDGKALLVQAGRDHFWRRPERLCRIDLTRRSAEQPLFDDYAKDGTVSPDSRRVLFAREGPAWWRKGYRGSQASQVWLYDQDKKSCRQLLHDAGGCCWPLWKPDGQGFYYVGAQTGSSNLREYELESGQDRQLTYFKDDSVVFPCVSRDGSTIVFRHLFHLYAYRPGSSQEPRKIEIFHDGDRSEARTERRVLNSASQVTFTRDGLELAFIAGGDLWVMDTELKEPRQVTTSAEEERDPVFSPAGDSLLVVSHQGGQCDLWKVQRGDPKQYWWQQQAFKLDKLTDDGEAKSAPKWSPDGKRLAYVRGRGELWTADADGKNPKRLLNSWNTPDYDWSPDGKWIAYAQSDNDFNQDVWILPADGSSAAVNVSRHPFNEQRPVWSPDGKVLAFPGRRASGTADATLCFVWLRAEDEEKTGRDRNLEKALEKIGKVRKTKAPARGKTSDGEGEEAMESGDKPVKVAIDLEKLHERVHRIALPDGGANELFWSPDSTKLAFTGRYEGKIGTYTIELAGDQRPKSISTQSGAQPHWLKQGNQIVWLLNGTPASTPAGAAPRATQAPTPSPSPAAARLRGRGATTTAASDESPPAGGDTLYRFQALQEIDLPKKYVAAFDLCWRTMRDNWYDERLGNRNWDDVRRKYRDAAGQCPDVDTLATVVQLMLGEINGSHLGFTPTGRGRAGGPIPRRAPAAEPQAEPTWTRVTPHLGLRFEDGYAGPGLKVRDVLPNGPTDHQKSRVRPGEIVLRIDGVAVDPGLDLTTVLNGPLARDIKLQVKDDQGNEREVVVRPIAYAQARTLLYEKWLKDNRDQVTKLSGGTLGYLHISAMDMPSFQKFEEELYSVGFGKEGLVIDVRENGGGSTTDHLLTALTQPVHAITVPRGGGTGYPQDRKVYQTWNKPIVVLCNQNSFSNAEIFSHAIKTLKRGQLVGVPTAGGVVSTGGTQIMDVGFLRLPFRGWFLVGDGQDMELNGAVPHHVLWPEPGQLPKGKDVQLEKAVAVLVQDVKDWKQRPQPKLTKATERR